MLFPFGFTILKVELKQPFSCCPRFWFGHETIRFHGSVYAIPFTWIVYPSLSESSFWDSADASTPQLNFPVFGISSAKTCKSLPFFHNETVTMVGGDHSLGCVTIENFHVTSTVFPSSTAPLSPGVSTSSKTSVGGQPLPLLVFIHKLVPAWNWNCFSQIHFLCT